MKDITHQGKDSGSLTKSSDDDPDKKTIVSHETKAGIPLSDDSCTKIILQHGVNDVESPSIKSENLKVCSHIS